MAETTQPVNDIVRNDAVRKYVQNLLDYKPDFLRMVYDTFKEFDLEELEQSISNYMDDDNNNNNRLNTTGRASLDKNNKNKGFHKSMEEFFRGTQYDNWLQNIMITLQKINKNALMITEDKNIPDLKNLNFIKNEDLPLKPEKRFVNIFTPSLVPQTAKAVGLNSNVSFAPNEIKESEKDKVKENKLSTFNFKRNIQKFITFTSVATIQNEKISEYTDDIVVNKNVAQVLKLVDYYEDNRMIFLDRIQTDENGSNTINPVLKNIELSSLDQRAILLSYSRLNFIQKVATIVNKFITSLKKLCKNKKEKEIKKEVNFANNMNNKDLAKIERSASQNSLNSNENTTHFNGKFRKEDKELISARSINVFSSTKQMDIKIIRKMLANKNKDRTEKNRKQKMTDIKEKVLKLLKEKRDEDIQKSRVDSFRSGNNEYGGEDEEYEDDEYYMDEEDDEDFVQDNEEAEDNPNRQNMDLANANAGRKRRTLNTNQLYDIVNELTEEKILDVKPKKKINYVGLKMFLNEDMKKLRQSKK